MISSNKVELLGKLGKDPIKFFNRSDNKPYCELSVCENTKRNGQPVSIWHKCEAWGDIATMMQRMNILPGSEMLIHGKLVVRPIKDTGHNTERICVLDFKVYRPNPNFMAVGEN